MALILEAGTQTHLDDREVVLRKKLLRTFNAPLHQELLRRLAGRLAKCASEMELAEIGNRSDFGETQVFFNFLADEFFYTSQLITRQPARNALPPRL